MWPDPDKEPLPPPLINSIQKKPPTRAERQAITKFSVWTPLPHDQEAQENHEQSVEGEENEVQDKLPPMTDKVTRWILQPKESKKLYVKFFSTKIGTYDD